MSEFLVATLGYVLAALAVGLWWGEWGRRKDLAWLVGRDRARHKPATVTRSPDAEAEAI